MAKTLDFHLLANWDRTSILKFFDAINQIDVRKMNLQRKIVGTLFFKSSLRTQHGFEAAAYKEGANVITFSHDQMRSGPNMSEATDDIVRIASQMCDCLVVRFADAHDLFGCLQVTECPLINAGNGSGDHSEHPTQVLSDLHFIWSRFGGVKNLRILLIGVGEQRVIRSMLFGLATLGVNQVWFAHSDNRPLSTKDEAKLAVRGLKVKIVSNVSASLNGFDVIYHNGIAQCGTDEEFKRLELTLEAVSKLNDAILMHSLPRVDEFPKEFDQLPCAAYFDQSRTANIVRRAVLADVIESSSSL